MKKPAVLVATALSTLALAGAVGVGVASADPTPAPTPSASAAPTAGAPATPTPGAKADKKAAKKAARKAGTAKKRDLTRRALHGEVTVGGKKKQHVVDFQRGTVATVSGTSVRVTSVDGFSATYVVDAKTVVRHAKQKVAIADVKTGDKVRVVATKDGSTLTATRIADRTK